MIVSNQVDEIGDEGIAKVVELLKQRGDNFLKKKSNWRALRRYSEVNMFCGMQFKALLILNIKNFEAFKGSSEGNVVVCVDNCVIYG